MPLIGQAVKAGVKLSKFDKRAWDSLYFGIRRDIKLGIKHGFGIGTTIGSFLSDGTNPFDDGTNVPSGKYNQFKKGNRRFRPSRRNRSNNKYCRPCNSRKRLYRRRRSS